MQLLRINSYAYFGNKQFVCELPLILSSSLINKVKNDLSNYQKSYTGLNITSLNALFNNVFGENVWGANQRAKQYIGLMPDDPTTDLSNVNDLIHLLDIDTSYLFLDNSYSPSASDDFHQATNIINVSGVSYNMSTQGGNYFKSCGRVFYEQGTALAYRYTTSSFLYNHTRPYFAYNYAYYYIKIYPDDFIINGVVNPAYANAVDYCIEIHGIITFNNAIDSITGVTIVTEKSTPTEYAFLNGVEIPDYSQNISDLENPYGEDGTSNIGGGDGDLPAGSEGLDFIDATDVPDLPSLSGVATGFITMYNPTSGQLSSLGGFLWSGMFDLDTYKKLFADPMQGIIGLGIVPVLPNSGGSRNIMFGNVDTGVNCSYLASQYAKKDCGSVNIQKYVGSFMDFSPYVKISLFLPYIGFVNLGTDDIMGGSINVVYNVDVLTGDCVAFIKHNTKGVLYAYHGNCLTNVPVSGQNYANALKNYYESVAGVIPATTNGATGGPAGAIGGAISGTLQSASNVILNSKPTFQRSGNIGGSAGIMGIQRPFIVIERPNISVPDNVQHYAGQTSNITMNLGSCSGYTLVDSVHLNGISATSQELKEIETLLKGGVIL